MSTTYKVTTHSTSLNVRSKPSTSGSIIGSLAKGSTCVSDSASNGWAHITSPKIGYASMTYLTAVSSTTSASSTKSRSGTTLENYDVATVADNTLQNPASLKAEHYKAVHAMGCPPMYNQYTDLQYVNDIAPGVGRVFATTMLSNPTILSICPGKVDYLPGFSDTSKKDFLKYVQDLAKGDSDLTSLLNDTTNGLNGKLFEFKADFKNYANIVNLLCRMTAIYLGIGDKRFPGTSASYKEFDYAYVTQPDLYKGYAGSLFKQTTYNLGKAVSTAVDDTNYIHFFVTHQGTSLSESISTSTEATALEDILGGSNTISSAARNIEFLMGGALNASDIDNDISKLLEGQDSWLSSFGSLFGNYLKGGRLVFPQMIGDVQYEKSFSCTCKFVSPYGSKESIFLRCYMPVMFLLAMSLPKQISDNMYTYPFLVRVFQKGFFNTDLAVITNLQITRGGSDDTSWTIDGLSTEIEVRFDVQPLYSRLMSTSARNPFLYLQNTALIEYLATMCGVDMKMNNLKVKEDMALSLIKSKVSPKENLTNLTLGISDYVSNGISKFFQIQNM